MGTIGVSRCLGDHDLYVFDSDIIYIYCISLIVGSCDGNNRCYTLPW